MAVEKQKRYARTDVKKKSEEPVMTFADHHVIVILA